MNKTQKLKWTPLQVSHLSWWVRIILNSLSAPPSFEACGHGVISWEQSLSYLLLKNPWYSNTLLLLLLLLLLESLFFIQVPPNTTPIVSTTLPFYPSSSFSPIIVLDKIETITYKHTLIIIIPIIRDFVVGFVWSGCCFAFLKFGRHGVGVSIIY